STALVASCSSSDEESPPANVEGFVGTWLCTVTIDTTFSAPADRPPNHSSFQAIYTITETSSNEIAIQSAAVQGCPTRTFEVSGNTATIVDGLICTAAMVATVTISSNTFTLSGDALSGSSTASATGLV